MRNTALEFQAIYLFAFYLLYSMSDSFTNSKSYSSDVIGGIDLLQ